VPAALAGATTWRVCCESRFDVTDTPAVGVIITGDGLSTAEIVADLPELEAEDVAQALQYAAAAVRERELPLRHPA